MPTSSVLAPSVRGTRPLLSLLGSVTALAIDPIEPRRVYAGTAGGGMFAIE